MMNLPIIELAKRTATDDAFIAFLVEQQARRDGLSWEQLAQRLKVEPVQLAKLALCKQPREEHFSQDVAQIAGYSGINRTMLLHFLESASQGLSIKKQSVQRAEPIRKWKGSFFMLQQRTWALGLATLLVLVLGAFVLAQPGGAKATLVVSAGEVVVNQAGGAIFAGATETAVSAGNVVTVQEGDTIRLDNNASAQLRLQDGSTVDLFSGTTLAVSELVTNDDSYRVRLHLFSGKTLNRVVRLLRSNDTFEVKTPSSTASVRGTVFAVETHTAETTTVSVAEGIVRVTMAEQSVDVESGFQVTARVGHKLQVVPQEAPIVAPTEAATAAPENVPVNSPDPTLETIRTATPTAVPAPAATPTEEEIDESDDDDDENEDDEDEDDEDDEPEVSSTPSATTTPDSDGDGSEEMVLICHYPSFNATKGITMEVKVTEISAHLAHGDRLGACPDSPTNTPQPGVTKTPTPVVTSTPTPTPSKTPTSTPTSTGTLLPTSTPTSTPTPTRTPSPTPTNTPTWTPSPTPTYTPTWTPTSTLTPTPTPTNTPTATPWDDDDDD